MRWFRVFYVMWLRARNVLVRLWTGGTLALGRGNVVSAPWAPRRLHITVRGNNNRITLAPGFKGRARITVFGDGNTITIGSAEDARWKIDFFPHIRGVCHRAKLFIGDRVRTSAETWVRLGEHDSEVTIGDDCTFSWGVVIWNTDGHALFRLPPPVENGLPFNIGRKLRIGHRVWLGMGVKVLKNTTLPDDTVVGMGAIVAGRFQEPFCVLAGNPAKVIRKGIRWALPAPNEYPLPHGGPATPELPGAAE